MNRRSISIVLGTLLTGTYAWQLIESYLAGEPPRWLHIAGLAMAIAFTVIQAKSVETGSAD